MIWVSLFLLFHFLSFYRFCFFSVFLLFSHAHFPFSSFLSLFIFLFLVVFLFCFFHFFFCLFLIHFFVSNCFSYGWFMMFLWFLLYCILSVFTSLIIFEFSFSFCLFSVSFSAFNLLFSLSFGFFRFFKSICSPTHCILLLQSISLFLTLFIPRPIGFEFLMVCENVFLLLIRLKLVFHIFGAPFF